MSFCLFKTVFFVNARIIFFSIMALTQIPSLSPVIPILAAPGVCLLGVLCVCDSVPPASFSLRQSYCSALASLYTDPSCWCVRSGRCLALRTAFWCSIRPGISAQLLLGSNFHIHYRLPGCFKEEVELDFTG